jgi:hypothetical protein
MAKRTTSRGRKPNQPASSRQSGARQASKSGTPAPGGSPDKPAGRLQQIRARTAGSEPLSRGQQRRRALKRAQRPWWRGPAPLIGTIVTVLVVIGIFIALSNRGSTAGDALIGKPAAASVVNAVTGVSPSVIQAVGTGNLPQPLRAISGPALSSNGKPEVLYIGGEFCPYCAADRWSLVNALSRFGTFSNLHYMRSATNDGNYATFTFHGSSYTSQYVSFVPIENEDRSGSQLEPLNAQQQQLFSTLGGNGYPFLDIAGTYASGAPNSYSGGYDPSVLGSNDWTQIAAALGNPSSPITQGIVGNANYLTAAICKATNNQPASACSPATIQHIEQQLPAAK